MTTAVEALSAQFTLLEKALDDQNEALITSIVNEVKPVVGAEYLATVLQGYAISKGKEMTPEQQNVILDTLRPLAIEIKTRMDESYVAPNLSPEVESLLLYIGGDMLKGPLKAGSPNWMMVPIQVWDNLLSLSKAAVDRHAD